MPSDALAPYCGSKTAFQSTYPLDLCLTNAGLFGDDITGMDRFPLWNGIDHGSIFQPQFYHGYYGRPQLVDGGVAAATGPSLPISSSSGIDDCIGPGSSSCPNHFGYLHQGLDKEASVLLDFRPSVPSVFEFDAAGTLSETSCSRPLKRARKQRKAGRSKTKMNGGIETDDLPGGGSNPNFSSTVPGQLKGGKMSLIIKSEPTGTGLPREENDEISAGSRSSDTWTREEDGRLASAVARHGTESWAPASTFVSGRTPVECASRWYGSLNLSFRRGRWTSQEDQLLKNAVAEWVRCVVGFGSVYDDGETTTDEWLTRVDACGGYKAVPWKEIAKITTHRNAVQCQTRWTETLDPNVKKSAWTPEEDEILIRGVETWSHSWNKIAAAIPGRTQRQCRSRYIQISTQRELAESASLVPASNDLSQKPPDPNFVPEFLQGNSTTDDSFWTRYEDFVTTECFESEARSGEPLAEYPGC